MLIGWWRKWKIELAFQVDTIEEAKEVHSCFIATKRFLESRHVFTGFLVLLGAALKAPGLAGCLKV